MNNHSNSTTFNGILIYVSAALLTLIIHEAGHLVVERYYGFEASMHPNYGSYSGNATDFQKIIIAAAGPLVSLFQGIICLDITRRAIRKNVFSLFILWLGLHGMILFFGYMVCAPFFVYGDTGQVFELLHFPIYITIAISVLFLVWMVRTLRNLAERYMPYGKGINNKKERMNQIILYPLIAGGVLTFVIQLPVPNYLLLFDCLSTPLMFLIVYGRLSDDYVDSPEVRVSKLSIPMIIIFLVTVLATRYLI